VHPQKAKAIELPDRSDEIAFATEVYTPVFQSKAIAAKLKAIARDTSKVVPDGLKDLTEDDLAFTRGQSNWQLTIRNSQLNPYLLA
jgi:hypothetical protein